MLEQAIGVLFLVLQVMGLVWGAMIVLRVFTGVGFDNDGQIVGVKPSGKFIIRGVNTVMGVTGEAIGAGAQVVKDLVGNSNTSGSQGPAEVLDFGKAKRAKGKAKAQQANG